ncbi:hydrogenase formation protein HypD [Fontivita pretiosa]|uniref:hydrogenase formation protein HypD n=1 Tax=Fontivita pretiosa TaxID=2989684 RepID=UPI003D16263C
MTDSRRQRCSEAIRRLRVAAQSLGRDIRIMEVCGTHTVNAFRSGLHSLMPANVHLVSGPGCPVCVTSQGDIDQLIELGMRPDVSLCTYGDMMRVTGAGGSLELARSEGADVHVVYSALDAVKLAEQIRPRQVVFAAVGFETTAPATAAAILEAERLGLTNFTVLASHKLVVPAMRALLDSGKTKLDGFLCPGHVSVITGSEAFACIVRDYALPCVVAGFEDWQIAEAMARLAELVAAAQPRLENQYPQAVTASGNRLAMKLIEQVFEPCDVTWRALGTLPQSGLKLRSRYALFDARVRYQLQSVEAPEPPGCRCGDVITGRCAPGDCKLFGKVCTPVYPVGPCMVSSEGTCQAWFKYHRQGNGRANRPGEDAPAALAEVGT